MSSSRAYANPKVGIVTTVLPYVISIVYIGKLTFAVYELIMMNKNDIFDTLTGAQNYLKTPPPVSQAATSAIYY